MENKNFDLLMKTERMFNDSRHLSEIFSTLQGEKTKRDYVCKQHKVLR